MKRFPFVTLIVSIFLTACSAVSGFNPAPTFTPLPTNTPKPTLTVTPTKTSTPTATSTPDVAATKAVQATQTAESVAAELDKYLSDEKDVAYKDGHLIWQQAKPMEINLSGPAYDFAAIDENLNASDFIFKSDVTWEATGLLECGAIFRSEADLKQGKQYIISFLRFSGLPAWEIDVYQYGRFLNSPSKIRFSDAVDLQNGVTNQFILVAQANQFTIYINGHREGRYFDYSTQRSDGIFGFQGAQDSGKGNCTYKNSWIWSLDQ